MRVLVADSDDASLEIVRSFLSDRRYEVETASDGLQCLMTMRDFTPDILVLNHDLLWGGGDGVMAQMRDDPDLAGTPVILITNDEIERLELSKFPPIAGWLREPFQLNGLLRHLGTVKQPVRTAYSEKESQ